ncbi:MULTISPECIES: thiosulfate sulfurtransferase GlpE [Corallincola]|uniref:Thiosulfate sulfurtransferase GlpE n=2 Tax=Corallincola TaxID=1775176 RepID=A0A368NNR2_9GAMM|nr:MULTISPECIES: thiosulfate sulfurtransferase GlpE [Corallincola]RCU51099.1 thiosulfate sulfurtransferase GlpE [Corallincola holothuriorum]TAA46031.1 thiosulfate sulfurtransferase GlpE [Corallincola spongiicola]
MSEFQHIDVMQTQQLLDADEATVVDIRDENSFAAGHIQGSVHLTNGSLSNFMADADFDRPLIVVCYHGISSQGAAQYMAQQGFEQVYSMDGGFEAWRRQLPYVAPDPDDAPIAP